MLAAGHCANGTAVGLGQDSMALLKARRQGRAAREHQLVHKIATLEDSRIDASFVLQDPKLVSPSFLLLSNRRGTLPASSMLGQVRIRL